MINDKISIAIDGPAGAGKSTIAKEIARRLNIIYIDTGAMYRALTYKILKNNIDVNNEREIEKIILNTDIYFSNNDIYIDGKKINDEIRKNSVSNNVSSISQIKKVREYMVYLQKDMATKNSVIMDGRDIGTVVLPKADYKFYLTASIKERAKRRYTELREKGEENISLSQIEKEIELRDKKDTTRLNSPLKKAEDAILIDNTNLTIEESIIEIIEVIESRKYVL